MPAASALARKPNRVTLFACPGSLARRPPHLLLHWLSTVGSACCVSRASESGNPSWATVATGSGHKPWHSAHDCAVHVRWPAAQAYESFCVYGDADAPARIEAGIIVRRASTSTMVA